MSITTMSLAVLTLIVATMLQQCPGPAPSPYKKLFSLPVAEQAVEFKKYTLEEQIDIYIAAMQGVEPPATQFANFLASNGKTVIPLLLQRLDREKDEGVQTNLIRVFDQIHTDYCNLKAEPQVVDKIKTAVETMKNKFYKDWSIRYLKSIQQTAGSSNSCGS